MSFIFLKIIAYRNNFQAVRVIYENELIGIYKKINRQINKWDKNPRLKKKTLEVIQSWGT